MGQKVHPLGFRLGITQDHQSHWFANKSMYPILVLEDRFIRNYCHDHFGQAGFAQLDITRSDDRIHLKIVIARSKDFIGAKNENLEKVRFQIHQAVTQFRVKTWSSRQRQKFGEILLTLAVTEIPDSSMSAILLANDLAVQLEKRIPFRRAMKTVVQRAESANVPGIKIQVGGRLNGAEIARTEWIRKGRIPLQTLDAKLDYHACTAKTIYGLLGIKVWLFRGMKNELSVNA
jgi:small subunit ribosomal protein S3